MEEAEDTASVLAAYRERKRKSLGAARSEASPEGGASPPLHPVFAHPVASTEPAPVPVAPPTASPPAPPPPAAWPAEAQPPVAALPAPPPSASNALAPSRSAGLASQPGATLSPLGPVLRLSDTLLKDVRVSVRGTPALRAAGVSLLLLGLGLVALDRRQHALGNPMPLLLPAGLAVVVLGGVLFVVGRLWPRHRRLAVRLAASQKEEWRRIQGETGRLVVVGRVGLGLAVAGLLVVASAYALLSTALLGLGALVAGAGLLLLVVAQVRRSLARRLYVQTLVLSGLEASGLGATAPDERVQPVILALDQLLGALPEAEVQRFLATPQARAYLELVDEATRVQRGP